MPKRHFSVNGEPSDAMTLSEFLLGLGIFVGLPMVLGAAYLFIIEPLFH